MSAIFIDTAGVPDSRRLGVYVVTWGCKLVAITRDVTPVVSDAYSVEPLILKHPYILNDRTGKAVPILVVRQTENVLSLADFTQEFEVLMPPSIVDMLRQLPRVDPVTSTPSPSTTTASPATDWNQLQKRLHEGKEWQKLGSNIVQSYKPQVW